MAKTSRDNSELIKIRRPTSLTNSFTNRSANQKRPPHQPQANRGSKFFAESSAGINTMEQFNNQQHQRLLEENKTRYNQNLTYNSLLASQRKLLEENKILKSQNHNLKQENIELKQAYEELQENYNTLLDSQKSFDAGKLLVFLKLKRRTDKETLEKRNIIQNEACFNTYLERVIMNSDPRIPKIVFECVTIIESNEKFMKAGGLYRVSGNHNVIQNLRYDINADNYKKLRKQKTPHEVCGILKLFLRELKEPLVSLSLLRQKIPGPSDMINNRVLKVLELVNSLDDLRKTTLGFLIKHLCRIAAIEENEMDTKSLGILMSSCIFNETLTDVCPERFETTSAIPRQCIVTMMESCNFIFRD
ncbi:WW domain-containing protein tag-325 [Wyeomyia smithii]|uniref:WW domain-containing protein tag-325 n=1 Tax=Wyeomyia smithii TaxID=174621 RepID=UPI0024680934|nr:WW domain-containing protein tag-325 [Wyeomyia smithii]